jgi:hypothetical protein
MRKLACLFVWSAAALLTACGGGSDEDAFRPGTSAPGTGGSTVTVSSVSLSSDKTSILNDGSETAEITAFVRDAGNVLLPNVPVTFTSSSGALEVRNPQTGAAGTATAVLSTAGVSTPRAVTITATAGGVSGTVTVQIAAAPPPVQVGTLTLTTSTPTIPSDGTLPATITAIARDQSNRFMQNVPVTFSSSSGGVTVVNGTTNANGQASATLGAASDPTNRNITVTASAGTITQTVAVQVTGTRLTVQGPAALVLNANATYTVSLVDSGDRGIPNRPLTVASARNNTVTPASLTTDAQGRATFTVTVTQPGNDTLTVTGLGLTATQPVAVNSDSFSFTAPATDNLEIPLGTPQTFTIRWLNNGTPVVGQPVAFSTTRGTLVPANGQVVTDGSGNATVTVSSTSAGGASVVAAGGTATASRAVEFVATVAQSIDVQASVFTLAPNEQTTLIAVVRDPTGNLVKNKVVTFTLQDVTGGTLSVATAITNSQGRAQTVYTAGSTASARDGVVVSASVQGASGAVTDSVAMTVARKELFISLGTGNSISEPNESQYKIQFTVQVTDANGNGVASTPLTVSILSTRYLKGARAYVNGSWAGYTAPVYTCTDEDTLVPATARNGQLDPGEDFNNSGRLEAGNIALVTPRQVTTNDQGFALLDVLYPQDHAYWLEVAIEARTSVQGTEFVRTQTFLVPGSTADFSTQTVAPPGPTSPFGTGVCTVPN